VVAVDDGLAPGIELVGPERQLLHRDEPRARERGDRVLPGVADIEDGRRVAGVEARLQRLGRDLDGAGHQRIFRNSTRSFRSASVRFSEVPAFLTYSHMYLTVSSRVAKRPSWKYGAVCETTRRAGTLNFPPDSTSSTSFLS